MSPNEIDMMLLRRCRQHGDAQAFAQIVDRHQDTVITTARQYTGCSATAQDVSQETFVRLWRTSHPPEYSLRAWLLRVAQQLAIDWHRSERSRAKREAFCADSILHEAKQWDDLAPHLGEAMRHTPQWSRTLLEQHFYQGQSLRELATQQSTSPATMSRRLQAALDELRRQFRKRGILVPAALLGTFLIDNVARASTLAPTDTLWKSAGPSAAQTQQTIIITSMTLTAIIAAVSIAKTDVPQHVAAVCVQQSREKIVQPSIDRVNNKVDSFASAIAYVYTPFIYVPGSMNSAGNRIAYFEKPEFAWGGTIVVITNDSQTLVVRNEQVEKRLLTETGKTIDQLVQQAKNQSRLLSSGSSPPCPQPHPIP